jgi:Flp pilus assembly protein TadD
MSKSSPTSRSSIIGVRSALAGCLGLLLAACATQPSGPPLRALTQAISVKPSTATWSEEIDRLVATVPASKVDTRPRQLALEALRLMKERRLADASQRLNAALQLEPENSSLQLLNGFTYQLMAQAGEAEKLQLAEQGYLLALQFDQSNWVAHYMLGKLYLEQRNFKAAQRSFAEVLLFQGEDQDVLLRMVGASYFSGDPVTAAACLDRLRALRPGDPELLRMSALVSASLNQTENTADFMAQYQRTGPSAVDLDRVRSRVQHWARVHRGLVEADTANAPPKKVLAQLNLFGGANQGAAGNMPFGGGFGTSPGAGGNMPFGGSFGTSPGVGGNMPFGGGFGTSPGVGGNMPFGGGFGTSPGFGGNMPFGGMPGQMGGPINPNVQRMVLVDVVIMRTEDSLSTRKGVNLLSALSLQFGQQRAITNSSGTNTSNGGFGNTATITDATTTSLTRAINIPMLTYSMNIANSNSNLNEVLARPTLAALEGVPSQFFSGTTLNAAVVSTNLVSGNAIQIEKEIGVRLSILPTFLPNNKIRLTIDAQRTFLKPPSNDVNFTYKLETSKIMLNANVVMEIGETLVLGGLTEKEVTNSRDGVPLLQDVPGLQYLFSTSSRNNFQRSVLMLITPREPLYSYRNEDADAQRVGGMPQTGGASSPSVGEMASGVPSNSPGPADSPSMKELRARYGDWFKPYPNLASVFSQLNSSTIYREFRTGDVTLERWDQQTRTLDRLKQALEFLFY